MPAIPMMMVLLFAVSAHATVGDTPATTLPLTIDERNAACIEVEDAGPARAVALADSVLSESLLSLAQRAEALGCRGWSQAAQELRDEARRDAFALQALLPQYPVSAERVRMTRRVGGILHRSGDRVGAVDMYAKAVADAEAQGLEAERIPLLVNLGVLHSEFEEHERARINYEQALALMARLDDFRHEAPVRFNLGLNLTGQGREADAVPHFRRALQLIRESGAGGPMQDMAASIALAGALVETGEVAESQQVMAQVRAMDLEVPDGAMGLQWRVIEARQRAAGGDAAGALALLDRDANADMPEIQQWQLLSVRASLLERLGRFEEAAATLRRINALRETHLRHQNHERLAALDAHMRDREQRVELERLQVDAADQEQQIAANARMQWLAGIVGVALLLIAGAVLLWQRRMNRLLLHASRTDPLTGLSNRRDMALRLRALSESSSGDTALLLIDIDLFKRINDDFGHDVGDEVLVAFAQRLREQAGAQASVARWGGEEFLMVVPNTDAAAIVACIEALRHCLAQPIETRNGAIDAKVSIGYANLPLPGAQGADSWHCSLQLADSALYLAKRSGRDAWVGYWIERPIPDWSPERLGREAHLARSLGLITPVASRPVRDALASVAV